MGRIDYNDGSYYIGDIYNGYPNGYGTYYFINGDIYEGDFLNGKFHGSGIFTYANGDKYVGGFIGYFLATSLS